MKNKLSSKNGFTVQEVVVAVMVLMILLGVISSIFTNIYIYSTDSTRNAMLASYITDLVETIDKLDYKDVTAQSLNEKIQSLKMDNIYTITFTISDYNDKDIVKTVNIVGTYKTRK